MYVCVCGGGYDFFSSLTWMWMCVCVCVGGGGLRENTDCLRGFEN